MKLHFQNFITHLPVILLVIVALNHLRLVYSHDASPWHGGSFGMFAAVDGIFTRRLIVEIKIGSTNSFLNLNNYTERIDDVLTLPTEEALTTFAHEVACDVQISASGSDFLTLYYYKAEFDLSTYRMTNLLQQTINLVRCEF